MHHMTSKTSPKMEICEKEMKDDNSGNLGRKTHTSVDSFYTKTLVPEVIDAQEGRIFHLGAKHP